MALFTTHTAPHHDDLRWPRSVAECSKMAAFDRQDLQEACEYARRIQDGDVLVQRVRLDPVRMCNLACEYCISAMQPEHRRRLRDYSVPYRTIESLVPVLLRLKATTVQLYGGGEPLLHPMIADIVRLLATAGLNMQILSNGTCLSSRLLEAVVEHRSSIRWLRFSVHGVDRESYFKNTGRRWLDRVTKNLADLTGALARGGEGPIVSLFVPVADELREPAVRRFLDFAGKCGMDFVSFAEDYRYPSGRERFPESRELVERLAIDYPDMPVDYCRNRPRAYDGEVCYHELTNLNLVYHSSNAHLMMVRCCNYYPVGSCGLPIEGFYEAVPVEFLYEKWAEHLKRTLATHPFSCAFRHECKSARRNRVMARCIAGA